MKVILILFFPLFCLGQKQYNGIIVDKITGIGVPYATVGLARENKGVNADANGLFIIYSYLKLDSLRISSVGYETHVIPVSEWINGKKVELQPNSNLLNEVVISSKPEQVYSLNRFNHCSWNWLQIGQKVFYQLAQRFDAPEPGLHLTEVELCKDPNESLFRIRIYDMDSSCQCPSIDLVDTVIEVKSDESHVKIDLRDYSIFIPNTSFFVAVEWLWIPYNEAVDRVKLDGKKTNWTWHKPAIRYVKNRSNKLNTVWELNYRGTWVNRPPDRTENYQLSVKLSNRLQVKLKY